MKLSDVLMGSTSSDKGERGKTPRMGGGSEVLPINELPLEYYEQPMAILGISMNAKEPTWIICEWCPIHGEFMVNKEYEVWLKPTHFCELPEVPK
jgi:hypothetical protein